MCSPQEARQGISQFSLDIETRDVDSGARTRVVLDLSLRLSSRSDPLTCSTLSPGFPPVHGIFRKPPPILQKRGSRARIFITGRARHAKTH